MYKEEGAIGKVAEGGSRDREIKKRETDEVKRGDLSMCVRMRMRVHACVCSSICVHLPPAVI